MTAECCSTFLMTILGVFLINQWNLAEGQFQIITINNGSLEISCKLRKLQNQHQSLISWRKDGKIIPKEHYVIQDGYAKLSFINATVYDRGFYYLIFNKSRNDTCKQEPGSTDTCSCKRDVKINVPDCRPNVVCSCIDLETMNCSFTDSICQFQNWKLKFKTLKITNCTKKNDNLILCKVNNNEYFTNNVSEWRIEAFNETSWAGVSFQFDSRKFVTFVNEPDLKVTKFPNSSVVLTSTMDRSRTSYYNNLYGSSDIIFKVVIKDQWESKEILTKKEYRFDTCPATNYNVAVSYQKEDSPLYDIWSKSRTEIIKTGSEVPLPVPEITDGCFMNPYDDVYLIYWKKVNRCYKNADFAYLLKCGEQTLTSTKKHSFTIVDYHSRCNEHPIQIFSTTNSNISKESASISIPKKVLSMPSSSLDVFYKKLENDTQYEISWKNKDFEISSYTIFYCKIMKDQNYFCDQSGIDWLTLNQKTLFFESDFSNYEKSKDNTYQLAISARNGSDNSGILWLNCIIPFEIEGDQSVEALQQAERGTTWMIIQWEFPCEKRSKQVEGFIIYWSSEEGDSSTIQNSSTLDWHQKEYNITGLYKGTNYSVSIGTKIKGQPNPHNVTQYFMTGSDGSSSTELWLIVILVAVIVISLTVIASYCIMKTWKIFKEKVDVTLPSGLTTTEQVQSPRNDGVLLENNIALILNNKENNDERRLSVINAFNANENLNNYEELMMCVNPGDSPSLHSDMYVSLFESLQTNLGEYEGERTLNAKHDSNTNSPEVTRENTPLTKGYVCFATGGEIGDQNRQQDEAKKKNGAYVQLSRLPIVTPTVEPSIQTNIHEYSYV